MASVVIKQGKDGMRWFHSTDDGVVSFGVPAYANKVVSVAGAGDTVLAAYVSASLAGNTPQTSLWYAALAAAVVVEKPYTSTVTWHEIEMRNPNVRL